MRKKKTQTIPKRNILFHFCVDKEESELIMERMGKMGMVSRAALRVGEDKMMSECHGAK
jgi:hypothetical protein